MKRLRFMSLVFFCFASISTFVIAQTDIVTRFESQEVKLSEVFEMVYSLYCLQNQYDLNDLFCPEIKCRKCEEKTLEVKRLFTGIEYVMQEIADGKHEFDEVKDLLNNHIKLLAEGTMTHLISFMVKTANDIKFVCSKCQQASWKKV